MSVVYDALTKAATAEKTRATDALNTWFGMNLRWIISIVFTLLFLVLVNQLVARVLRQQMDETALLLATNLSDAAATYLASKDFLRLNTTVTKYALLKRVLYVSVRDHQGKVIAHSPRSLPSGLEHGLGFDHDRREVIRREITLDGQTIYETSAPILEGQLGRAHIGISAAAVQSDIDRALFLFVWPIAVGLLAAGIIVTVGSRLCWHVLESRRTWLLQNIFRRWV
jgi:sensor histidine kinase regulating citrate/malate metabolism